VLGVNRTHWRSADGGATFAPWTGPARAVLGRALAWHGTDPARLLYQGYRCDNLASATCYRRYDVRGEKRGARHRGCGCVDGLTRARAQAYVSSDAGTTWAPLLADVNHVCRHRGGRGSAGTHLTGAAPVRVWHTEAAGGSPGQHRLLRPLQRHYRR
jgi:hypothetical protein